jgi:hypothetical protein
MGRDGTYMVFVGIKKLESCGKRRREEEKKGGWRESDV